MEPDQNVTFVTHCVEETGISMDFETFESFIGDTSKEPPEEFYCYLQCVFTDTGLIDENGDVNIELYTSMFPADKECLKKVPQIVKCTDMKILAECDKE